MDSKEWFKEAKFGFMSHFGLYSVLDGMYRGKPCNEWVRHHFRIPMEEYHTLAKVFNPVYFSADEWVKTARDAGMKYMVLTAKHHEGFAMYHSRASKFNVVDATPFGRDIVGELAESCYKNGMKFGIYYSQDLDWDDPDGGGIYPTKWEPNGANNVWDFDPARKVDFARYFEGKVIPQVKELLTGYGDLCLIWFDCPWTLTKEQSERLYRLVKDIQPDCLVSSRLGNGFGDYGSGGDNELDMNGNRGPAEVPATISGNGVWCFSHYDMKYKDAETIIRERGELNARGVNYLLNIGPDHLGRLPGEAVTVLSEVGRRTRGDINTGV